MSPGRFGHWTVHLGHRFGRCAAEVVRGGTRSNCFRSGSYGWDGQGFCYQHHPDWEAWHAESLRLGQIAQAAIDKATESKGGKAE